VEGKASLGGGEEISNVKRRRKLTAWEIGNEKGGRGAKIYKDLRGNGRIHAYLKHKRGGGGLQNWRVQGRSEGEVTQIPLRKHNGGIRGKKRVQRDWTCRGP